SEGSPSRGPGQGRHGEGVPGVPGPDRGPEETWPIGLEPRPQAHLHGHHHQGAGRQDPDHRRPLRRDPGTTRRLLRSGSRRPGRGHRHRRAHPQCPLGHGGDPSGLGLMRLQPSEVEAIYRREAGRVLATLIRLLGDFELAQDARQDAFAVALDRWPRDGLPDNPRAWLVEVGRNKALDQKRRAQVFKDKVLPLEKASTGEATEEGEDADAAFGDDRLRLIFTCCHPALNPEVQVALTLRAVCGLSTEAVARAFLVAEDAMAQRLVRAQRKIREAGIPYEIPEPPLLDERMQSVLAVIYSVFTEGYSVTSGERLISAELCLEAIRLGRLMDALLPQRPDVLGLLALMLLHDARREAR